MTRSVWIKADDEVGDWDARRRRITTGLEAGVDWILVDESDIERAQELGDVNIAAFKEGGDVQVIDEIEDVSATPDIMVIGKAGEGDGTVELPDDFAVSADLSTVRRYNQESAAFVRIHGKAYEEFARQAAKDASHTIVIGEDWQIIPLENLIASIGEDTTLIAGVESAEEARTAFETLELGVDGVLLDTDDPNEIRETVSVREDVEREKVDLEWAEVVEVESTASADRVCVDTASIMADDEGMLVGSLSRGLFFVYAETAESPYVASRPFRVNAGAVHAYVRIPDRETKYLGELKSGDTVQVVDTEGKTREAIVGRAKIEKRPMFRVVAETGEGDVIETLLQNAETIKIHTREGKTAVTDLAVGDELLIYYEDTARHFGEAVSESIIEK